MKQNELTGLPLFPSMNGAIETLDAMLSLRSIFLLVAGVDAAGQAQSLQRAAIVFSVGPQNSGG
jgi:hypothetical protein